MKKLILNGLLIAGFTFFCLSLYSQMPAAITIVPENATVYDEITLTFDPDEACFQSGSLSGLPYIAMHSGVTIDGNVWQNVVGFDGIGNNGQTPILSINADTTYSITYIPFDFYGFAPGANVTHICAVFNNGAIDNAGFEDCHRIPDAGRRSAEGFHRRCQYGPE